MTAGEIRGLLANVPDEAQVGFKYGANVLRLDDLVIIDERANPMSHCPAPRRAEIATRVRQGMCDIPPVCVPVSQDR